MALGEAFSQCATDAAAAARDEHDLVDYGEESVLLQWGLPVVRS